MSEFKSVDRHLIQKAFAIAHRSGIDPRNGARERKLFYAIARCIWEAASEDGPYRKRFAARIEDALKVLASEEMK